MSMDQVRDAIRKSFDDLGYTCNISATGYCRASMDSNILEFVLKNANPKRFEITVTGHDKSEFLVNCVHTDGKYEVFERFRKEQAGVEALVKWISTTKKSFKHLHELLEPPALPEQYGPGSGNGLDFDWSGERAGRR